MKLRPINSSYRMLCAICATAVMLVTAAVWAESKEHSADLPAPPVSAGGVTWPSTKPDLPSVPQEKSTQDQFSARLEATEKPTKGQFSTSDLDAPPATPSAPVKRANQESTHVHQDRSSTFLPPGVRQSSQDGELSPPKAIHRIATGAPHHPPFRPGAQPDRQILSESTIAEQTDPVALNQGTTALTPSGEVWQASTRGATFSMPATEVSNAAETAVSSSNIPISRPTKKPAPQESASSNFANRQIGTTEFVLAAQPQFGAHFSKQPAQSDRLARDVEPIVSDFAPTPIDQTPYDAMNEAWVYEGKTLNANRRPLVELGRPWYQLGELRPGSTIFGSHNLTSPQFLVYGDYRTAYASNDFGVDTTSVWANELNLNFNLQITATERFTAFIGPLDNGIQNNRWLLDEDVYISETDAEIEFGMFEGDLGAIVGGMCRQTLPFDLPFAVGVMPMIIQNGVWMEDAILGVAATIPARNSPALDISNMDITFFAAFDNINSPAFDGNDDVAKMYGVATFIDALGGYIEADYAFLEDRNALRKRSYHNIGLAYSRRYGRFVSNSTRVIANAGQSTNFGPNTADGVLLLSENSLITACPERFVPYFNLFAGFDRPQSAARAAAAGGILNNTGILFETDGMTGFPTLDPTANNTWGGAFGMNIMTPGWTQQLILELALLNTFGDDATRIAVGDQYGAGARYQIPLSNAWIFRADAMYGWLRQTDDIHGIRTELRYKF